MPLNWDISKCPILKAENKKYKDLLFKHEGRMGMTLLYVLTHELYYTIGKRDYSNRTFGEDIIKFTKNRIERYISKFMPGNFDDWKDIEQKEKEDYIQTVRLCEGMIVFGNR